MSIVRSSKFRHVFGHPNKPDQCFMGVKTSGQGDRNLAVNSLYMAVVRDQKVFLLTVTKPGRYEENQMAYIDSKYKVWDVEFSPFNDRVLAVGTETGDINVYLLPEEGLPEAEKPIKDTYWELHEQHSKKVQYLVWHPSAEYILASGGADSWIILWNVEAEEPLHRYNFPDTPYDLAWNKDGSLFAVVYNNKNKTGVRIIDPRSEEVLAENSAAHEGTKSPKVVFLKNDNIITIGSNKQAQKSLYMWNRNDLSDCLEEMDMGSSSGVLNSYYDSDLNIIFTFVKGEGAIKYYEIEEDKVHYLSAYSSSTSLKGGHFIAKRCVNPKINEIARFFKLEEKKVEPISLIVPRKSEHFQSDIFPDCCSAEPTITADEWIAGKNAVPKRMALSNDAGEVQTTKKAPKRVAKQAKTESSHGAFGQPSQNNYANIPEGIDFQELLEDMKKVKATVRKLNKRVTKLEELQEQVNSVLQNEEEEEEEE